MKILHSAREEIGAILKQVTGTMRLIVMLLYGTGVRIEEGIDLRVKDLDFDRHQIVVRQGKGRKDRVTMLPSAAREALTTHLADVRRIHEADLAHGFGRVVSWRAGREESDGSALTGYARASRVSTRPSIVPLGWKRTLMYRLRASCFTGSGWLRASAGA